MDDSVPNHGIDLRCLCSGNGGMLLSKGSDKNDPLVELMGYRVLIKKYQSVPCLLYTPKAIAPLP